MFEDPELPDFDSMSQEELIEWLEQLAKSGSEAASEFLDDYPGDDDQVESEPLPDDSVDEEWSGWMDDTEPLVSTDESSPAASPTMGDEFEDEEDDLPVDWTLLAEEDTAPTAAMDWLEQITTPDEEQRLPDITDYQPPEPQSENLGDFLSEAAAEEPLDWLERLAGKVGPPSNSAMKAEPPSHEYDDDDIDDEYEDDETLDDLEDESLYSKGAERSVAFLESILGLEDRESEKYSTESMAPVPDDVTPSESSEPVEDTENGVLVRPSAAPARGDSLTQAFLMQDQQADLEAWYANRLNAIAVSGDRATGAPTLPPAPAPSKPPPPGLAAAIYSARGKVDADELQEALLDYETLLRTSAGLEWVVGDMRGLIARERFRANPSVHRVLGDALMRQGHLNAAIDVYRHALSLL